MSGRAFVTLAFVAKVASLASYERRRDALFQTAQSRQRLFVPTVADASRAFEALFTSVTGASDPALLTESGDGLVSWSERVDMNEYEQGRNLLLPGDALLVYSWRDDIVAPPACEILLVAATPAVAADTRARLAAVTPLLPLVIATEERLPPPDIRERWESREWTCLVSSMKSSRAARDPIHQIYIPIHDVGPPMGRETDYEVDYPELSAMISSLRGEPASITTCDFRFATREDFDRTCTSLMERLLKRP